MATQRINELLWAAFTDADLRHRLLNGQRREVVSGFGLSKAEEHAILGIEAKTLESLAAGLCQVGLGGRRRSPLLVNAYKVPRTAAHWAAPIL